MADSVRTPSIYFPKSLSELITEKGRNPNALILAGGTYAMSRITSYPQEDSPDILSLDQIPELAKVVHTDRFLEAGATTTIEQLLNTGSFLMGKSTFEAIEGIATSVIRSKATIGGALCTPDMRFFLSCILATTGAQAELRLMTRHGRDGKRITSSQNWLPVRKLYSPSGKFLYAENAVLSRVRIPTASNALQIFRSIGNPMREPDRAVYLGLEYTPVQSGITQPNLCIAFPMNGFFSNIEFNTQLSAVTMPLEQEQSENLCRILENMFSQYCPDISPVQKERALRLFSATLGQVSQDFMALE